MTDGVGGADHAYALRTAGPDGVARQDAVDLVQRLRKRLRELAQSRGEAVRDVGHEAADARETGREPCPRPHLLQVVDPLALLECPQERREGAQVDRGRAEPD